jgi:hypothetical protein
MTHVRSMDKLRRTTPVNVANTGSGPADSGPSHDILEPGKHLRLRVGSEVLSGIVDDVMPDKSCFWIWADGGMGRRMIAASDVAAVGRSMN